ncbi:MAG: UDP-N-acetyl glucosamine 2-epimerase, partial [Bacteroidetes bacterium]|nr:UDP-N-acetyl glucosamine 2-epimerase [Bacteroidota bacterium]
SPENVKKILALLNELSQKRKIIFPVHPRTLSVINDLNLTNNLNLNHNLNHNLNLILTDPIGYIDFLALTKNAELVITDSGGIQEESTYLGVQCITVRNNTERPVTVVEGTNQLIGTDLEKVKEAALKVLNGENKTGSIPELWDGHAAERIVKLLIN